MIYDDETVRLFTQNTLESLFRDAAADADRITILRMIIGDVCRGINVNKGPLHKLDLKVESHENGVRVNIFRKQDLCAIMDIRQIKNAGAFFQSGLYEAMYTDEPELGEVTKRLDYSTGGVETAVRTLQRLISDVVLTPARLEEDSADWHARNDRYLPEKNRHQP